MAGPGRRGTAMWAANRFKSDALVAFVSDLRVLEREGLVEDICTDVRQTLSTIQGLAAAFSKSSWWTSKVGPELTEFLRIYTDWNDINGSDPDNVRLRAEALKKLQGHRKILSESIRKNQQLFEFELERKLFDDTYAALGALCDKYVRYFTNLQVSVDRYAAGKKG